MKMSYILEEEDLLTYNIYMSTQSDRLTTIKSRGWMLVTFGPLLVAIVFIIRAEYITAILWACFGLFYGFFYERYWKWRINKNAQKHIRDSLQDRIGTRIDVEFMDDHLITKDKSGTGTIVYKEIKSIVELPKQLLLFVSTGLQYMLPKRAWGSNPWVMNHFQRLGIPIIDKTDWDRKSSS